MLFIQSRKDEDKSPMLPGIPFIGRVRAVAIGVRAASRRPLAVVLVLIAAALIGVAFALASGAVP
jgi:hypothetical protein